MSDRPRWPLWVSLGVLALLLGALASWLLRVTSPQPAAPPPSPVEAGDADADGEGEATDAHAHDAHAHDAHGHPAPPSTAWTPELDARAAAILEDEGLAWTVTCVPEPADFDPGHPMELFEDTFILPSLDLPGGAFRHEVTERQGFQGLHDHGETRGLLSWDLDADPPCVVVPEPSRRIVDTLPEWQEGWTSWACDTPLDVDEDGRVDQVVPASHKAYPVGGVLGCRVAIDDADGQRVYNGRVAMEGDGPGTFTDWEDVRPTDDAERPEGPAGGRLDGLEMGIGWFEERLAEARAGDSRVEQIYRPRLDALRTLMERDPTLAEALADRLAYMEQARDDNVEEYIAWLEERLEALQEPRDEADPAAP